MHDDLIGRIDAALPAIRETLDYLIRIPSVSSVGFDAARVRESAVAVADVLAGAGFDGVRLLEMADAHPAVYGELAGPEGAPTVLLYAHHDVQPAGDLDLWDTPPFEPIEQDGRLYGRGSSDDKCGIAIHLAAMAAFGFNPPVNVKVFIEGEEEIGSLHLEDFLEAYADLLAADVIVIADSGNWQLGVPALTTTLRGLVEGYVEVRTLETAVHSGVYGGALPDALTTLAHLLASLHDEDGEVAIEGLPRSESEPIDYTEAQFRKEATALPGTSLIGSGSISERVWAKPAVSVLGIDAPRVDEAINCLVPRARAKISIRTAPGTDPKQAGDALVRHLEKHTPWGAELSVKLGALNDAANLETRGAAYDAFRRGMEVAWGTSPVEMGIGGSIPFVGAFQHIFPDAAMLLTGVSDPDSRYHGPNESVDLAELRKGMIAEAVALQLIGA